MIVYITATSKIGNDYLIERRILGESIFENLLRLAKDLGAQRLVLNIPVEKQNSILKIISKYVTNYEFDTGGQKKADLVLDIANIYNHGLAKKSYKKYKTIDRAIIWKIKEQKDIEAAEEELRRTYWFPIGRYYIVYISKFLASKLSKTPVTANQVTLLSFLLGLLAGVLLLFDYWPFYVIASLCYILFWILDITDGKLARRKNSVSSFGAWFDPVIGEALDYIVYFFIVLSLYLRSHSVTVLWLGVFYFIGKHLTIFAMSTSAEQFEKERDDSSVPILRTSLRRIFAEATHFIHDSDVRIHFLALAMLLNVTIVPLTTYAIYYNIWFIVKLVMEYMRYRKGV